MYLPRLLLKEEEETSPFSASDGDIPVVSGGSSLSRELRAAAAVCSQVDSIHRVQIYRSDAPIEEKEHVMNLVSSLYIWISLLSQQHWK